MSSQKMENAVSYSINNLVDIYAKVMDENIDRINTDRTFNIEYEVRFDSFKVKNQAVFEKVFKYLYSHNFQISNTSYNLKTTPLFEAEVDKNFSSKIRIEVDGLSNIQEFCKYNDVDGKNKKYVLKEYAEKGVTRAYQNDDFKFRTSIQKEITLHKNNLKVTQINNSWGSSLKTFRYVQRSSLTSIDFPNIRVDMSKVKMNKQKNVKIGNTNIFNEPETFDIEIELLNPYNLYDDDFKNSLVKQLKIVIKYILSGIQGTNFPQTNDQLKRVYNNYMGTIKKMNKEQKDVFYKFNTNYFIGPNSYTLQKENLVENPISNNICIKNDFCVTDKADGERKMLYIYNNMIYLINTGLEFQYSGLKINPNTNVKNVLIDGEHIEFDKYGNYINLFAAFDLYCLNDNDYREKPFIEDRKEEVSSKESRYGMLKKIIKLLNGDDAIIDNKSKFNLNIAVKKFYISKKDDKNSIFKSCKELLTKINDNTYNYNTDGMIFTSKYLGVTQEYEGDIIKKTKYTWKNSFKWKPPEFNTIDFLVRVKKDHLNQKIVKTKQHNGNIISYYELELYVGYDKKRSGVYNSQMQILNKNFKEFEMRNDKQPEKRYPVKFYPTNPNDLSAHICHIELSTDTYGNYVMHTEEKDLMEDDTVVEFKYVFNKKDRFMSWVPIRVRHDKTNQYRYADEKNKTYGNAYHVADSNWHSIHNPITEDIVINGSKLTLDNVKNDYFDDVYYNSKQNNKNTSKTNPLRDFHNRYVKSILINYAASQQPDTHLIDMAVGRGGDLSKWVDSNVKGILGIDIKKDNIHNSNQGACARYVSSYYKYKDMPFGMFIVGDTSKLIKNGNFDIYDKQENNNNNSEEKIEEDEEINENVNSYYIVKTLMGDPSVDKSTIKYPILKENYGIFHKKFDICSIQFSMHYMFENKETLHNFLTNVSDYTKMGKYFIGTCYDGNLIYNEFKDKENGETIELYKENTKIWHITKKYDDTNNLFEENDENSLGYKISVYQESINKEFDEYLVNFKYFIDVMKDYGFTLEQKIQTEHGMINSIGNFEELYTLMKKNKKDIHKYKEAKNMSYQEKKISFFNKYYVFRKTSGIIRPIYDENMNENTINFKIGKAVKIPNKMIKLI